MRPRRVSLNPHSLVLMGVPTGFIKYTIDDFKTYGDSGLEEVKSFCKKYLKEMVTNVENGRGIFFCGSNGVGKSMLSCILLKEAYTCRYSSRRITFSRYIDLYTSSWQDSEDKDYEIYKGIEFLVLEEIGKEIDSKIAKPILEDLLRYREEHLLPTIICSNLSPKDIEKEYGASITSLIRGNTTRIKIVGKDRRF